MFISCELEAESFFVIMLLMKSKIKQKKEDYCLCQEYFKRIQFCFMLSSDRLKMYLY